MTVKYLNVGCGRQHQKSGDGIEWINIDRIDAVNPDMTCDMTQGLPFEDGEIAHIQAIACLGQIERNKDFLFVMNEFWRVLKSEGTIFIYLPHKDYEHTYQDPFNQRRFNEVHWEGFNEPHPIYQKHLSYYGFKPWKNVVVSTNEQGFLSVHMTVKK
jgi:predicted SAM-dependent methyltransferase